MPGMRVFFLGVVLMGACGPAVRHGGDSDNESTCTPNCSHEGAVRCNGSVREVCQLAASGCVEWVAIQDCSSQGLVCVESQGDTQCAQAESCSDGVLNQDESDVDCGGSCDPCPTGRRCHADSDCASGYCRGGTCAECRPSTFRCFGNYYQTCNPDGNSWSNVSHCDPTMNQICDATLGGCREATTVGTTTPTGVYYQYAEFCTSDGVFKGGFDVGSLDDLLFVNRDGQHVDVYRVEIQDSDGDGVIQPNQHPDNPDAPGPMEQRTLVYVQTYDVPVSDGAFAEMCTGGWTYCSNEIQPMTSETNVDIYFISQWTGRLGVAHYDAATGAVDLIAPWDQALGCDEVLGHDPIEDVWYVGVYERKVYSYHAPTGEWVLEFVYPDLAGDHMDGLEVVVDPNTNIPYVYVSDMTSDFIAQYHKRDDGTWEQVNVFRYNRGEGDFIEGMGFGALNHFWMSAVVDPNRIHETNCIYEIGGGDLTQYIQVE